jgi:hypothetical protein
MTIDLTKEEIERMMLDDKHDSLKQFEKWYAKGHNAALKKIIEKLNDAEDK